MNTNRLTAAAPARFLWTARALMLSVAVFSLAGAVGALAQNSFNVGTNLVDLSRMKGNETDPAIALDTLRPSNMFIASATDGKVPGLVVALTTNAGVTWISNVIATNNNVQGLLPAYGEPSVAWDFCGNLFLAYLPATFEGLAIALSTNGGRNFFPFTNLAALDVTDQPRLATPPAGAAAGSLWVVYKDYTSANTPLQVQGLFSTGLGTNGVFSPVQIVPGSSGGGFADIAVGPLGEVLVAFQDNLENLYPSAIVWASVETNAITNGLISTNGFAAAQPVASDAIGGATYIEAERTGIGVNAAVGLGWDCDNAETNYDNAYLVYTARGPNGNLIINFCSSTNRAMTWSAETPLDDDALSGNNDHFLPRIAVDPLTGIVGSFWYDCRNDQGSSSLPITNVTTDTFTFANEMITNITIADNLTTPTAVLLSTNATDNSGQGTDWTVIIAGENIVGTQIRSINSSNIYVYGATNTNFFIGLDETNGTGNATVTVIVTNIFPYGYTSGSAANQEAVPYATVSLDGGQTFLPNQPLISLNLTINPPAHGIASGIAGSDSLTGWGHYTALAAYGANFFPVWADNSDVATNNPDGANTNFDLLILAGGASLNSLTIPTADLSIRVTNSPNPVISEGVLIYTLIVSNNGPHAAAPVTVTNSLSPSVTLVSVTPSLGGAYAVQSTADSQMIILSWPTLAVHASLTNTIRVTASTSAVATNLATVYSPFIDLVPGNNSNELVVVIAGQDLAMGMTTSQTNVLVGDTVVSWITVTNLGPATNGPVFITNAFSTNWTNIAAQAPGPWFLTNTPTNILLVIDLGYLPTNQPATAIVTAVALGGASLATQSALVFSQDVDTNLADNSAAFVYFVNDEDLAIGLATPPSVNLGVPFTYTMSVTNFGLSYTGLITVTNTVPVNVQPLSASQSQGSSSIAGNQVLFTLGTLGPGRIANLAVSAMALSLPASAAIAAQVSSTDFDTNSANADVTNWVTVNGEDLSLALSASLASAQVGQTVTYIEYVTNLGPSSTALVLVTNVLSTNLGSITVLQPANYTLSNNVVVFNLGALSVNQIVPITLSATPLSTGFATNTAVVGGFSFDPNLSNNFATAIIAITPTLPLISNLVVSPLASSAFISWKTGFPATAQVLYGPSPAYGAFSPASTAAATNHAVLLSGLTAGVPYYFEVLSWVGATLYTTNGSFSTTNSLILDTPDASYWGTGEWTAGSVATGAYHNHYQTAATTTGSPTAWAVYTPPIPAAGLYNVAIWHPQNSGFTTNAQVYIFAATNQVFASVDETVNGGGWQPLASNVYFAAGSGGNVTIYNNTGETNKSVAANAMMWTYVPAQDYPTNGTVPAWWANFYFGAASNGNVSGSADPDGDGYSNFAEYVLGTDPTDPASHLNFSVAAGPDNSVTVTFSPCQGGRAYELEAAANLAAPAWTALTNGFTVNTNGAGVFTLPQADSSSFYRLSAQIIP
jgi:uncharacterized repeat protein (TIGR01451 family)